MLKINPKNKTVRKLKIKKINELVDLNVKLSFHKEMENEGLVAIIEHRIKGKTTKINLQGFSITDLI